MNIGLDIGGTKCAISTGETADGKITILSREEFPTAGLTWRQVLDEFARRIELQTSNIKPLMPSESAAAGRLTPGAA